MINPDELLEIAAQMEKPLELYLKYRQVVGRYDQGKKSKLAMLMKGFEGSVAARESEAYASKEWRDYLDEWDKAQKAMVTAQVKYDTLRNKFEALRTVVSYSKEHMKVFGG